MNGGGAPERIEELRLDPESIEALARRLAELLVGSETQRPRRQLLSAGEVSEWWGMSRRWVYEHAERLGARRIGTGARPRLRFDPEEVAERLGEPDGHRGGSPGTRGLAPISGDCSSDSLSVRSRAIVAARDMKRPGRRANAPRPGAEGGPSAR